MIYVPEQLRQRLLDIGPEVSVLHRDDGGGWQARIQAGQFVTASSLIAVDRWAREQLDDPRGWINYRFQSMDFDLDARVREAREMRRAMAVSTTLAQELTMKALSLMPGRGVSLREKAILLGICKQRVAQLSKQPPTQWPEESHPS